MRKGLSLEVEKGRTRGKVGDTNGAFSLVFPKTHRELFIIVSDGFGWEDHPLPLPIFEHVSVSSAYGIPTYYEMQYVKGLFWEDTEWVVQYFPAKSDHINIHPNVLHLWKVVGIEFPIPPKACV